MKIRHPFPRWTSNSLQYGGRAAIMEFQTKKENKRVPKRRRKHDPVYGVCCHWCRQKTVEDHVRCSICPRRFCGSCLLNRHGEDIHVEMNEDVRWVCPRCRGGCGPGCVRTCCNCGPCRKKRRLEPTGQLVKVARTAGFNNVHDYLVHLQTGESAAAIAGRKVGRGWTAIDQSVAIVTKEDATNLAWAKRRVRSLRWCVANSKWGNQSAMRCGNEPIFEQIQAARLLVARLNTTWDIGRKKTRSKSPQSETDDPKLVGFWMEGRNN